MEVKLSWVCKIRMNRRREKKWKRIENARYCYPVGSLDRYGLVGSPGKVGTLV
jgi:hypothetical protein